MHILYTYSLFPIPCPYSPVRYSHIPGFVPMWTQAFGPRGQNLMQVQAFGPFVAQTFGTLWPRHLAALDCMFINHHGVAPQQLLEKQLFQ